MGILGSTAERQHCRQAWFDTTHWSTVLAAGEGQSPGSIQALERLCRKYWYPLYAYVRGCGLESHDAEDVTQEFLARFLAGNHVARASPDKGRFRFYLLGALKHFLSDVWDRERRLKRGGGQRPVSLDTQAGDARYRLEPKDESSPDRLFERRWALTLLEQVLTRLGKECRLAGKGAVFERLIGFLTDDESGAYRDAARDLRMSEGAVRVAVHRLRRRYGELLRLEIAHTVACPDDVGEEMRHLREVLRQ